MQFLESIFVAASLEFRQRIRAGRWKWILGGWFALNLIITALMFLAFSNSDVPGERSGSAVFGYLMFFALALLLLVCPSLTAQSVNGDRERGTLAILQVTRLTALEITLGKLLAAWLTAIVFILLLIPLVIWCMIAGSVPFKNVVAVFTVLTLLVGIICAISLALSALFKRSSTSTVMSYLAMFTLTVITLLVFALVGAFFKTSRTVDIRDYSYDAATGQTISGPGFSREKVTEPRRDLIWWILAPNPVVVMADASPTYPKPDCSKLDVDDQYACQQAAQDPLRDVGDNVRNLRVDPFANYADESWGPTHRGGAVWPYGLTFDLFLAVGAVVLTARRLKTPARKLPRGQRIA